MPTVEVVSLVNGIDRRLLATISPPSRIAVVTTGLGIKTVVPHRVLRENLVRFTATIEVVSRVDGSEKPLLRVHDLEKVI